MAGKAIKIGEALHRVVEAALTKGPHVNHRRRRTAAENEALRLRNETAAREKGDFSKKHARGLTDDSPFYMAEDAQSSLPVSDQALNPEVQMQLNQIGSSLTGMSIMEEIHEDRMLGKLRPFVEGEPIGCVNNGQKRGPAPPIKTRNEIMDERQQELRERQRRNDGTLDRMLGRLK